MNRFFSSLCSEGLLRVPRPVCLVCLSIFTKYIEIKLFHRLAEASMSFLRGKWTLQVLIYKNKQLKKSDENINAKYFISCIILNTALTVSSYTVIIHFVSVTYSYFWFSQEELVLFIQ